MIDTKVINNTSIACMWANGMRVAGGRNSILQNNLITDPSDSNGIRIGKFGTTGNPCESVLVTDNLIVRGCGIRTTYGHGGITIADNAVATIQNNRILDNPGLGIDIQNCTATISGNTIEKPALQGLLVKAASVGSATITYNTVANLKIGYNAFQNAATSTFTVSSWNNSWQPTGIKADYSNDIKFFVKDNTLHLKGLTELSKVEIYTISGQLVLNANSSVSINISTLKNGVYILHIENFKPIRFLKN